MIVIVAALGWILGMLVAAYGAPVNLLAFSALGLVGASGIEARRVRSLSPLILALLLIGSAGLAAWRFQAHGNEQRASKVAAYVNRSVVDLRGAVTEEPVAIGDGWQFPIAARQMELGGDWVPASGTVMVRRAATARYRVGDVLDVSGVLQPPDPQLPPFLSPFRQSGVVAITNRPAVVPLGTRESSVPVWLANRREDAAAVLNRAIPEPEAGLARGVTLGERRTLGADLDADFQRTNTTHILAVDGLKVGYVAALVASLFGLVLAPLPTALGTILGVAGYTVFVGASPSAVRAAVMGGLFALGRVLGRPADSLNWLALAVVGMSAVNPFVLWTPALQLSALTTAGLCLLVPVVDGWVPGRTAHSASAPHSGTLREALVTTVAAEIASAPLVTATFAQVSLASLPVHLVVMPILPLAIFLSALTAATGGLLPWLGNLVGLIAWVPLAAIVGTVRWAGQLPVAALALPSLGVGWVIVAYAALGIALLSRPNPFFGPGLPLGAIWTRLSGVIPPRVLVPAIALPVALGAAFLLARHHPTDRLIFPGASGDAVLIESADGGHVYLQGNGNAPQVSRALAPALPFWNREIDLAVLTAGNDDALTDLGDLSGRLSFRQAIVPERGFSDVALARWKELARDQRLAVAYGRGGTTVRLSRAAATIYALDGAPKQGRAAAIDPSLAVLLTVGSARVLWVSALPADQAALVAAGVAPSAQILKLAGRSARWGLDPTFLQRVNPSVVILPYGASGRFAKPTPGTLEMLARRQVLRTDLDGTVTIEVNAEGIVARKER